MEVQASADHDNFIVKVADDSLDTNKMPSIESYESGEVDKKKRLKKLFLIRRLFRWKSDLEPLTPISDGLSSPSERLSFKSDGSSPKITTSSYSSFFGLSDIGKKVREKGDVSAGLTFGTFPVPRSPILHTEDLDMTAVRSCIVHNHIAVASETGNSTETVAAVGETAILMESAIKDMGQSCPSTLTFHAENHNNHDIIDDYHPSKVHGSKVLSESPPASFETTPHDRVVCEISEELVDKVEYKNLETIVRSEQSAIQETSALKLLISRDAININVSEKVVIEDLSTPPDCKLIPTIPAAARTGLDDSTSISAATHRVGQSPKCKLIPTIPAAARTGLDESTSISAATHRVGQSPKCKLIPTIPAAARTGLDDSTSISAAPQKVGLSSASLLKGLLSKGRNNNRVLNQIFFKVDEIQESTTLQAVTKGVSVAAVVKKFQSFTTSEAVSFDDDSEADGEAEELVDDHDHNIERLDESCLRKANEEGSKVGASVTKSSETSPLSTGRFQKRLVYLNSVDKLNSSLDKVYNQKIRNSDVNFDPSSLSSDDSQNESSRCKGSIYEEGSSESYNMNDFAEPDSFDGVVPEDDISDVFNFEILMDLEKAAEDCKEENLQPDIENVKYTEVSDAQEIVIQVGEGHGNISENNKTVVVHPIQVSFFARLFGVNGPICCGGVIRSDNNSLIDSYETLDKNQVTVSSDNVTSEEGEYDNSMV